jgi:hypothetical protein
MKIISNSLQPINERWDDPGDYPNALAAGPLPSYEYTEEVIGEVVLELGVDDLISHEPLIEIAKKAVASVIPSGITVTAWDMTQKGHNIHMSVLEFDGTAEEE